MSNETITPERIALPKQVVEALDEHDPNLNSHHAHFLQLGARIALAAIASGDLVMGIIASARLAWDAGPHEESFDVFVIQFYLASAFLAPQPKMPKEWVAVIADYEGIEVRNLNDNQTRELFEKLFALKAAQ